MSVLFLGRLAEVAAVLRLEGEQVAFDPVHIPVARRISRHDLAPADDQVEAGFCVVQGLRGNESLELEPGPALGFGDAPRGPGRALRRGRLGLPEDEDMPAAAELVQPARSAGQVDGVEIGGPRARLHFRIAFAALRTARASGSVPTVMRR